MVLKASPPAGEPQDRHGDASLRGAGTDPAAVMNRDSIRIRYPDGRGILRDVLRQATGRGFAIDSVSTDPLGYQRTSSGQTMITERPMVEVTLHVHGRNSVNQLAAALSDLDGVHAVIASDVNAIDE